jgi:hypothetical protein
MARSLIRVNLELDNILVHDEGDGWGDAEPYLWTVFFKVDGETVTVLDGFTLSGSPTIHTTPGSHGNLGTSDADEGDNIVIPSTIGEWQTILAPIPVAPSLSDLADDFGGLVGVVAVLMEEDSVTDDGAEAGHRALNQAVQDAIQRIIDTRNIGRTDVTEEEIAGFEDSIASEVEDAIRNQQNFFENLWSWLNPDDTIGTKVFTFTHDDLDPSTATEFSHRWEDEGDWEIFGHVSSTVLCPANALSNFFAALSSSSSEETARRAIVAEAAAVPAVSRESVLFRLDRANLKQPFVDLGPLRSFRDNEYRRLPGLARWFQLLERHTPRLIYMLAKNKDLRDSARALLEWAPKVIQEGNTPIGKEQLHHAERLLLALRRYSSRRARIDASRALDVLPLLRGKTTRQALKLLNEVQPARHPNVAQDPDLRVRPKKTSTKTLQKPTTEERQEYSD